MKELCLLFVMLVIGLIIGFGARALLIYTHTQGAKIGAEVGYFEGQLDAINNDFSIEKNSEGYYVWSKSPWETGDKPKVSDEDLIELQKFGIDTKIEKE